jgi:hypothetical protein
MATEPELRLLHSYEEGPRIWDAASLQPQVISLSEQGLIQPYGNGPAYQITEKGKQVIGAKALHDLISHVEHLAREARALSNGHLSIAFVNNHGETLRDREGMSWTDAHNAADRALGVPDAS